MAAHGHVPQYDIKPVKGPHGTASICIALREHLEQTSRSSLLRTPALSAPLSHAPHSVQALADDGAKFVCVVLSGRAMDVFKTAEMIDSIVNVCLAVSSRTSRIPSLDSAQALYGERDGWAEGRRKE